MQEENTGNAQRSAALLGVSCDPFYVDTANRSSSPSYWRCPSPSLPSRRSRRWPLSSLVAPVVAVGASPHSHVLRIARGSEEGVHRGMPVVAPDGVVGTIALTTAHYADVQLIVSPTSAVPALNERTRARATVKG